MRTFSTAADGSLLGKSFFFDPKLNCVEKFELLLKT